MAAHAFKSCQCLTDLQELNDQKHCDPGQLEGCPDGKYNGVWIFVEDFAEVV